VLFSRILGGIGRVMIASGVLILLFVTYQLWGTGLRTDSYQNKLGDEFNRAAQAAKNKGSDRPAVTLPGDETASGTNPTSPTTAPGGSTEGTPAAGDFPPPKPGNAIGQIKIPKIGVDFFMVEGVDLNYLAEGPGHFPGTPFPGQAGNAALAGHRTTWKAPFNRIDELVPGDKIEVTTIQGDFTYEVMPQPGSTPEAPLGNRIVTPTQTEILEQPPGQNSLTLMACHPKYSAAQRIIVVGKLVNAPAATTGKSEESKAAVNSIDQQKLITEEGGGNALSISAQPEARGPAIVFSIVAGVIWLAAWFVARRWGSWRQWQKWAVYAVALPIFLVPLFFAFENINHLLPAGY
jgi:sortase A